MSDNVSSADKTPPNGLTESELEADGDDGKSDKKSNLTRSKSINKARLAAYSTAMESIQAQAEPIDEEEDVPYVIPPVVSRLF